MARDQGVDLAGVPFDDQGMQVEALPGRPRRRSAGAAARHASSTPCPTFHNPTGVCLANARRRRLVETAAAEKLAGRRGRRVQGAGLRRRRNRPRCGAWRTTSRARATTSCAWAPFPRRWRPACAVAFLRRARRWPNATPSPACSTVAAARASSPPAWWPQMILEGSYDENVARIRTAYAERCRALRVPLCATTLPAGCSVGAVGGGFFTWVNLPDRSDGAGRAPVRGGQRRVVLRRLAVLGRRWRGGHPARLQHVPPRGTARRRRAPWPFDHRGARHRALTGGRPSVPLAGGAGLARFLLVHCLRNSLTCVTAS